MKVLTQRQIEVLDFIKRWLRDNGMPPTIAEITQGLGFNSTNSVRGHLQALDRKGAIELMPGASRGIRLLDIDDDDQEQGLPIVGRVAAGHPILAEENIDDHCAVDGAVFKPRADYLLRVQGMSMKDVGIVDGDLLAVHRTAVAKNGQIVVARLEDEVTVKRLQRQGNIVYLEAENPAFEAIKINLKTQVLDIEGIAVGVLRQL